MSFLLLSDIQNGWGSEYIAFMMKVKMRKRISHLFHIWVSLCSLSWIQIFRCKDYPFLSLFFLFVKLPCTIIMEILAVLSTSMPIIVNALYQHAHQIDIPWIQPFYAGTCSGDVTFQSLLNNSEAIKQFWGD